MEKNWIKDGKFVALEADQLKELEADQLAEYTYVRTEDQVKTLIADSQKGTVSKTELEKKIKTINTDIEKLTSDQIDALKKNVDKLVEDLEKANKALDEQGTAIKALKETGKVDKNKPVGLKEAFLGAIMEKKDRFLTEVDDDYGKRFSMKEYFENHSESPKFTIKVVDMLQSNIVQSEVNLVRLTELDPNRVGIPLTIYPHVIDWMPSKGMRKANMSILVVYDYSDGAGTKTEGSASSKSSFLLKTVEFKAFYIATYFTISDEVLDDLDEVMDEIAITAPSKILDNIDEDILGTTGNDSSAIAGLFTSNKHTDYATATYENTVKGANMIDLIAKARLQCSTNKYLADVVIMNPDDVDNFAALKDADDNSILDRRVKWDANGMPSFVMGMRIIQSTAITANTLAVVDSKQLIIGNRKDMSLQIGLNGTDLTEGQRTVVIKIRLAFGVRDKAAVIYSDDITTDVTAIEIV